MQVRKREPKRRAFHRYMTMGYKSLFKKPDTFFKDITELPRAHVLEIDCEGKENLTCYWNPQFQDQKMSYDDAISGFKEKLIQKCQN